MTQEQYTTQVRILNANEGMMLTQADENIEIRNRIISDRVYLADTDTPESWKEITREEADRIEAEQSALYKIESERRITGNGE